MQAPYHQNQRNNRKRLIQLGLTGLTLACLSGCATVPVHKQGQLAKAEMLFDDSATALFAERSVSLLEPGVAASGGGSASGCSSCR